MMYIDRAITAPVMNMLPSPFDVHMLEKRLLRVHPDVVANEILAFRHTSDPLHQFSAAFARWIDREFEGQIRQTHKVLSENLGGEQSQNQEWEKIVPHVV